VVYVPDASRSVGVCSDLLSDERAAKFIEELRSRLRTRARPARRQEGHAAGDAGAARANKHAIDWAVQPARAAFHRPPPVPQLRPGRAGRVHRLGPFFQTWDLAGKYPDILRDEVVGSEAQRVFSDGKRLLQRPSKAAGCRPTA
jgi:5-methyltetrahydrofolate--homocysteine methyltransferase